MMARGGLPLRMSCELVGEAQTKQPNKQHLRDKRTHNIPDKEWCQTENNKKTNWIKMKDGTFFRI